MKIAVEKEPNTHDYRRCYWGHNILSWDNQEDGTVSSLGIGSWIKQGDYILTSGKIDGKSVNARYRVDEIKYFSDPTDMWNAKLSYHDHELRR